MRLFLAINFPPDKLKEFREVLNYWQNSKSAKDLRVVSWQNLHLTISFLGEVGVDKIDKLGAKVTAVAQGHSVFSLAFSPEISFLPNRQQAKVIFHKLAPNAQLSALAEATREAVLPFSSELPSVWRPHITLARIKSHNFIWPQLPWPTVSGSCLVDSLDLMKSTLTAAGPIYECLKKYPLIKV